MNFEEKLAKYVKVEEQKISVMKEIAREFNALLEKMESEGIKFHYNEDCNFYLNSFYVDTDINEHDIKIFFDCIAD